MASDRPPRSPLPTKLHAHARQSEIMSAHTPKGGHSCGTSKPEQELEHLCFSNMIANPQERFFFKDLDSRFLLVSEGWLEAVGQGRTLDDIIGKTDFDIASSEQAAIAFADEQRVIATGQPMPPRIEHDWVCLDTWSLTLKMPLHDSQGKIVGTWGTVRDITAQIKAENELKYQALHDAVTGLPNRLALMDRLEQAVRGLERNAGQVALLFVDLDGFKAVNDTLGHEAGDYVLLEVGRRLVATARHSDTVARLGGDEFIILCPRLGGDEGMQSVSDRIVRSLRKPIEVAGEKVTVTGSVGVISTSDPTFEAMELLQQADKAMYEAKNTGRNGWRAHMATKTGQAAAVGDVEGTRSALEA